MDDALAGCGHAVPELPDTLPPATETAFAPLRLVLQPGGMSFELARSDMVLGRHSGADVRLPLPDVSRRHCRFVCLHGIWRIYDLDSMNGLFVNGQRVRDAVLHDGDVIGIGGFSLKVEINRAAEAPVDPAVAPKSDPDLQRIRETLRQSPHELWMQRRAS
jgi:pSer/pThr/pTyr-binding forkhead associated (FHA) protein